MKRFDFDSDNDDDESEEGMEHYFNMDDLEDAAEIINATNIRLAEREQNRAIFDDSMRLLEKSWFWRFYSPARKLKEIEKAYAIILALVEPKELKATEEEK